MILKKIFLCMVLLTIPFGLASEWRILKLLGGANPSYIEKEKPYTPFIKTLFYSGTALLSAAALKDASSVGHVWPYDIIPPLFCMNAAFDILNSKAVGLQDSEPLFLRLKALAKGTLYGATSLYFFHHGYTKMATGIAGIGLLDGLSTLPLADLSPAIRKTMNTHYKTAFEETYPATKQIFLDNYQDSWKIAWKKYCGTSCGIVGLRRLLPYGTNHFLELNLNTQHANVIKLDKA